MVSLMEDWIAPVALEELASAFDCLGADYRVGQNFESAHISCSSEGVVTVRFNVGRHIQILDVRIYDIEYRCPMLICS
jgi:hypothetical protein